MSAAEECIELALKYLEEGRALVERDPLQALERLYRAAEEAVRALALHYNLRGRAREGREEGSVDLRGARESGESDRVESRDVIHSGVGRGELPAHAGRPRGEARQRERGSEAAQHREDARGGEEDRVP